MPTRRLLIDSIVAVLLAAVLAAIGWLASDPLLRLAYQSIGLEQMTMTSRYELVWYRVSVALAFALPAPAAWIASLVHRALAKAVPSAGTVAVHLIVPAGGVLLAIATRLRDFAIIGRDAAALGGIEPMLAVGGLDFGTRGLTWGATLSVVMCIVVAVVASRRKHRV